MPNQQFIRLLQDVLDSKVSFDEWRRNRPKTSPKPPPRPVNTKILTVMTAIQRVRYRRAGYIATQRVRRAVIRGILPNLKLSVIVCVDCNKRRATCYDHRDYNKPLEVAPVCVPCNTNRGVAKY